MQKLSELKDKKYYRGIWIATCKKCGNKFPRATRYNKLCNSCRDNANILKSIKMRARLK